MINDNQIKQQIHQKKADKIYRTDKQNTLYVWVGHEVEEASEQGVGRCVSPSKVNVQSVRDQLALRKRRALITSLERQEETSGMSSFLSEVSVSTWDG